MQPNGIEWRDVLEVAPVITTGMSEEEAAEAHATTGPRLVYIYDDSKEDEDQRLLVEEHKTFVDGKILFASRFFKCLRIDKESALEDRLLKKHAKRAPCLVFVRPNWKVAETVRPKFSAKKIYTFMTAVVKKDYKNCIPCALKEAEDVYRDRAKLERDKAKLLRLNEKIDSTRSARKRESLARDRDRLQARVEKSEEKLNARESEIFELQPKT